MSASGVDKAKLYDVGRDVLLVRGYDPELDADPAQRTTRSSKPAVLMTRWSSVIPIATTSGSVASHAIPSRPSASAAVA